MKQINGTGRESERQPATMREMQQLHIDSERQQATMRESERHVTTTWDRRDSERQPATTGASERHAVTQ